MRGPNAEAHGVECYSDSTGNSEEHVSMYADVVVAAPNSKQYLTWRGQYPLSSQASGGDRVEPLLQCRLERGWVNSLG